MLNPGAEQFVRASASKGRSGSASQCRGAGRRGGKRDTSLWEGSVSQKYDNRIRSSCHVFLSKCRRGIMDGPRRHSLSARNGFLICAVGKGSDRSGMTVDWPVRCDKRLPCVRRIGLWRLSGSREISRRVAVRQLCSAQGCCCEVEGRLTRGILGPPAE